MRSQVYNCHKLGKYLHLETVLEPAEGKMRDVVRMRATCDEIAKIMQDVYSASLWDLKFGPSATCECVLCRKAIKRRLSGLKEGDHVITECGGDCPASYQIELLPEGKVYWRSEFQEYPCQHSGCTGEIEIWKQMVKPGSSFKCNKCGKQSELGISLRAQDSKE